MAVYAKGYETKRKFVTLAYEKLLEKNVSEVTVRELASEKGYSAPAIYKHFESLEYLLIIASVKFVDEYMSEYASLLEGGGERPEGYLNGWRLFNRYAFERPDIYYRLFWGQYNKKFSGAIREYYELFPFSGSEKNLDFTLYNDNIQQRDFLVLSRLVKKGWITEDDAEYLSKTTPLIVKGMLLECMEQSAEKQGEYENECNSLLEKNLERIASLHY